jgi:23S rRNA (cytosine1962-C5)-methyltransferase
MLAVGKAPFTIETLASRIDRAIELRQRLPQAHESTACRLINAEGDFLPGFIVDKYDSGLCFQVLTAGMELLREPLLAHLEKSLSPAFMVERSDTDARAREGLAPRSGLVKGILPDPLLIKENGLTFGIDLIAGQKTGFFLDQRYNRELAGNYARDAVVCDCFAYSGGFSVYALARGAKKAHVVDVSADALSIAANNMALN